MRFAIGLSLLALLPTVSVAGTIWVPDDYPTIQGAIDHSVDGDEILVLPGTYVGGIDFKGLAITVRSQRGPDHTVIDGNRVGSTVYFQSGETSASVLEGFRIVNGVGSLESMTGRILGGGMYCFESSPTLIDCVIRDNVAEAGAGMMCMNDGSPTLVGCTITENHASDNGGGLFSWSYFGPVSSPTFIECTITNNTSAGPGNYHGGGAMSISRGSAIFTNCMITDNHARYGGGICLQLFATPVFTNCLLAGNTADSWGGGILSTQSSPLFVNCDVIDNQCGYQGGGILAFAGTGDMVLLNSIVHGNVAPFGPQACLRFSSGVPAPSLSLSYSDVQGGQPGIYMDAGCTLNWGAGMIDADPLFTAGPRGASYLSQLAAGQAADSPCLDQGDPFSALIAGTTRTDHVPDSGRVDMGYHYDRPSAGATFRNYGTNPASYTASTFPALGTVYTGTVDLAGTTGHAMAWLVGYAAPLTHTLVGGQTLLVDIADPNGELLYQWAQPGPIATFTVGVPHDLILVGVEIATQAVHFSGVQPKALSNAQDLTLGW